MHEAGDLPAAIARFRLKLQLTITTVVVVVTGSVLLFAQRRLSTMAEADIQRDFQHSFQVLRNVHEQRRSTLLERCEELGRRLHIEARPGDDLLALLYPGTQPVLRGLLEGENEAEAAAEHNTGAFHAEFYRFLDGQGNVLAPPAGVRAGPLTAAEGAQLKLTGPARAKLQFGFLVREKPDADGPLFDLIAFPIAGPEDRGVIATLVLGFEPANRLLKELEPGVRRGVWIGGRVFLLDLPEATVGAVTRAIQHELDDGEPPRRLTEVIGGEPHALLCQRLNQDSAYPPAFEVCLYPLTGLHALQQRLRWQVFGVGGIVLLLGVVAGHVLAVRFAQPVQRLAMVSAEHDAQRRQAEAALVQAAEDMRRAARFSADASHQLKTPVTTMRAGLEALKVSGVLPPAAHEEIGTLVHQTYRLSGLIEDLLLLSRMDAGRLEIDFGPVDLVQVIRGALDDHGVRPDPLALTIETDLPAALPVTGEKRYLGLILENLLENAGKYNRPRGRIRLTAAEAQGWICVVVGNTAPRPIPPAAREHIFDRFHRAGMGEDIPGYGLGLNLARELARLHHGDLALHRSDAEWTEFELRLPSAPAGVPPVI